MLWRNNLRPHDIQLKSLLSETDGSLFIDDGGVTRDLLKNHGHEAPGGNLDALLKKVKVVLESVRSIAANDSSVHIRR